MNDLHWLAVVLWGLFILLEELLIARRLDILLRQLVRRNKWKQNYSGKKPINSNISETAGEKPKFSTDKICELHAYLSFIETQHVASPDDVKVNCALAISCEEGNILTRSMKPLRS
ncbi:hypothetical protein EJ110_NYTH49636 [Nymphaea thermarum]|nr:hypothetical protein EJ110_NYTH49636 [Nymphaea thermarum]